MEAQSYPYTAQTRRGGVNYTYRPLVDVVIGSGDEALTFKALIDSGTEVTAMDMTIARLLGIEVEKCKKAELSGLGGSLPGFVAPVSFTVEKFPRKTFTFEVVFVEDLGQNFEIILGQQDFFLNFNVTFKRSKKVFYLELV